MERRRFSTAGHAGKPGRPGRAWRLRPPLLAAVLTLAVISITGMPAGAQGPPPAPGAGAAVDPADPGNLGGVWLIADYKGSQRYSARERIQMTADGKPPPLQPWAAALLEKRIADSDKGEPFANTVTNCLPAGMPAMMFGGPTPIQIIPTARQVTMLFEELGRFRTIYLNEPHPKDPDPGFMGHSVGHWEGAVLVVDTIALNDKTTIDGVGMPHTDSLHTIERLRRTGPGTMEVLVTIDDPKTFTSPWTAKAIYRLQTKARVSEYVCENNRNGSDAPGGATGFNPPASK